MQLNELQKKAVEHTEGPLLVLAGAGSGKTRVVTHRIAYLIDIGVPSSDIVAVTFTNKAALEMKERVKTLTNQSVITSTFHALCMKVLKESIQHLGYNPHFSLYDENDSQTLIKQILKTLKMKDEKGLVKSIKHEISQAKNNLRNPQDYNDYGTLKGMPFKEIFEQYQTALKKYNALDFDDLLYLTAKLFTTNPEVLDHYQNIWSFLLIDEYQDTNHAQYQIAKAIVGEKKNIFAVGDPDQSIYSWRGADINNIMRFEQDFPGAIIITLDQNYRSSKTILKAANSLIQNNSIRYEKNLWSSQELGEKIHFHHLNSDLDEANHVIKTILSRGKEEGIPLSESVIFYRTNSQSRSFEDFLIKQNIPYHITGGVSFYERREIKDILSYIRILLYPNDFISFKRIINAPKRGFGQSSLEKFSNESQLQNISVIDLCVQLEHKKTSFIKLNSIQRTSLGQFLESYFSIQKLIAEKTSVSNLIQVIIEEFNYSMFLKEDPDTFSERIKNIDELCTKAIEYENSTEFPSIENFLDEVTLQPQTYSGNYEDRLNLMTIHNSKGLEFSLVYMVGMEEDLFPHINSKENQEKIEEERRLCYVGMTRAKKLLFLSAAKYRILWGQQKLMRLSRFISEINPEYFAETIFNNHLTSDEFEIGSMVEHRTFGKGIIRKKYQSSLGITYDVYFHNLHSTKTLVGRFAKLIGV